MEAPSGETYDPEAIAETIDGLREGDRVELRWQSDRSHTVVDARGTVDVSIDSWDLRVEADDRDSDVVISRDGDTILAHSIYDGARTTLGELVDVRRLERGEASRAANPLTREETTADLDADAETLVLVGCGDAKADERRPAKDLYTSNYFGLKRRYAEEVGDDWAILSAAHGLLDPDVEIEPYDTHLDDVDRGEWEVEVLTALSPAVKDTRVILLAGPEYAQNLESDLYMYGADVEVPTEGMRIGERMSWLSEALEDDQDEEETVDEPEPPESAPKYVREGLERQSPETLEEIAAYAERLAEYKRGEAERELEERSGDTETDEDGVPEEWDADDWDDALESSEAPSGATLTKKTIDGRRYYYHQWREGDSIKSEYIAPVVPAGSSEE